MKSWGTFKNEMKAKRRQTGDGVGKKNEEDNVLERQELVVSSEGKAQKYTRVGPREIVKKPLENLKSTLWRAAIHKILLTTHSQKCGLNKGHKPSSNETKQKKRILPFIKQYHPAVPNLKETLTRKWYLIQQQPLLNRIFKGAPHNIIQRRPNHVFRKHVACQPY